MQLRECEASRIIYSEKSSGVTKKQDGTGPIMLP
jgi:hypothetical protein